MAETTLFMWEVTGMKDPLFLSLLKKKELYVFTVWPFRKLMIS
jgi:hypothetical protein